MDQLGVKDLLNNTLFEQDKFEALFNSFDQDKSGKIFKKDVIDLVDFITFENKK